MINIQYKTLEDLAKLIDFDKELFFDTETKGLYGEVLLAQFYQIDWDEIVFVKKPELFMLVSILSKSYIVMQNSSYDISTIQRQLGHVWVPERFEDTLYLARLHFFEKDSFTLDNLMIYALGYDPYKKAGIKKKEMQKANWEGKLTDDQEIYAALDVYHLPDVYDKVKVKLDDFLYKLDMISLKEALVWQNNGFPVDKEKLAAQYLENQQLIQEEKLSINCNSYVQVRSYIGSDLSDDIGLATEEYQGNQRAAKVRRVRKLEKQQSFMRKFETDDGQIYGLFAPSARSGRYTCKNQNLQQLPRKLKHVFGLVPELDTDVLIYSDFPGLELRGACTITGESRMEVLFRQLEDLHDHTAEMLFGKNFTPEERHIAKTANFALLFGASWKILGIILLKENGMYLPEDKLRDIKRKWNGLWTTITTWQTDGINRWRKGMPGSTPLGRRYVAKMMTDYLNLQVQGFGAEIAKLAMHYMIDEVKERGWYQKEVKFINFVHDSYFWRCINEEEIYIEVSKITANCMQKSWFSCTQHVKIKDLPMPIQVTVGHNVKGIDSGDHIYKYELEGMSCYNEKGEY